MNDVLALVTKVLTFLPEIIGLYEAVERNDETDKLNASLALIRAMKDAQARKEMGP